MTPMQMLKNNFAKLIFNFFKFKEINLNKAQAKDICIQNVDNEYALCFPNEETNQSHYVKKDVNDVMTTTEQTHATFFNHKPKVKP